jgi:hypothetical protein
MIEVYNLFRIDFDNSENEIGNAISKKLIATFWDGREGTAHLKCDDYLQSLRSKTGEMKPVQYNYLGWNKEIYPQYKVETSYKSDEEN